jgi:hypothetical protein
VLPGGHQLTLEEQGPAEEVVAGQQDLLVLGAPGAVEHALGQRPRPAQLGLGDQASMDAGQRRQGGRIVGHLGGELAGASERGPCLRCARAEQLAQQVAEPHLHPELTAGALGRGRHGPEQLQRPAELLLGLLEGQPGHRQVGRGEHPRQRRVSAGHGHRGPGMPGDLQHVLGVVAVQARQGRPTRRGAAPGGPC